MKIGVAIVVLAIIVLGYSAFVLPPDPSGQLPESALFASSVPSASTVVMGKAWANKNRVSPPDTLRIWLHLSNVSKRQITGLRIVDFQAPGFLNPQITSVIPTTLSPGGDSRRADGVVSLHRPWAFCYVDSLRVVYRGWWYCSR